MDRKRTSITAAGMGLLIMLGSHSAVGDAIFLDGQWGGRGQAFWTPQVQPEAPLIDGFSLTQKANAIEDTPAAEAINQIKAGQWIRAIQTIESLDEAEQSHVTDSFGVIRPVASLKSSLILSLPDEGRRAFRKLNEPAAQTKLDQARAIPSLSERTQTYAALIENFPLCDQAGVAAGELGDLHFEQGRFNQAASMYRFAIDHPANTDNQPSLVARRLIALNRAGLSKRFDELTQYAGFRYGDTAITLGGESVTIGTLIDTLSKDRTTTVDTTNDTFMLPMNQAAGDERSMIDRDLKRSIQVMSRNYNINNVVNVLLAPKHVADDGRLFTLTLGSIARIDPETGQALWRLGEVKAFSKKVNTYMTHLQGGYHQSLAVADDILLVVLPNEGMPRQSRLVAMHTETGKVIWDSKQIAGQWNNLSVYGEPFVDEDTVYITCQEQNKPLLLVAADLKTGSLKSRIELGKVVHDTRMHHPTELSPRIARTEHHLIVQTNNGALIAINRQDNTLAWAFTQKIRLSGLSQIRNIGYAPPGSVARHTGTVMAQSGLVIAKDTRGDHVHAFHERDGRAAWSAKTDKDATIVHTDSRHVYVQGDELVALNLKTGERVWWTEHAGDQSGRPAFTGDTLIVAGDRRLCQFDLATGRMVAMNETLTERADLSIAKGRLIRITDDSLSIEPLTPRASENTP